MKISIVLPVLNEELSIGETIDSVNDTMSKGGYEYEIIVVDDGSKDNTLKIAGTKNVTLLQHPSNLGTGAARKTGILNSSGDIVVTLDADGSYPIHSIPELLKYFPEYDQVIGARLKEEGKIKFLRIPTKWLMRKLASYLTQINIPDPNSGLRAFKKELMKKYLYLIPDRFSCVTTMTIAFLCNNHRVKFIPIEYYKRIGKSKFHPIKDTANYLVAIIRIILYFYPLRIFLPLSILIFLYGSVKSVYDVLFGVRHMQQLDIVILITSLIIFITGLLADLIVTLSRK